MRWYTWFLLLAAVIVAVRIAAPLLRRFSRWRIRKAAERRWKRYARATGKDWTQLTPKEKLEAHGVDVDGVIDGE